MKILGIKGSEIVEEYAKLANAIDIILSNISQLSDGELDQLEDLVFGERRNRLYALMKEVNEINKQLGNT